MVPAATVAAGQPANGGAGNAAPAGNGGPKQLAANADAQAGQRQQPEPLQRQHRQQAAAATAASQPAVQAAGAARTRAVDVACEVCRSTAFVREPATDPMVMLLCDGDSCLNGCHLGCCDPPKTAVPQEDWFCRSCERSHAVATGPAGKQPVCMVSFPDSHLLCQTLA